HEYGHVLNFGLARPPFVLHRVTWYENDFVEGPSEFLGRWGTHPDVVARYTRHHRTGEPIPSALLDAVQRAESLNASFEMLRLLGQARFDALIHGETEVPIEEAWRLAAPVGALPLVEGTFMPASLSHVLGLPYDAALYGYAWSRVIR